GTGGAVHRTHRSPTGRAAPRPRSRLLRRLGADPRQGLLERGHRRLGVPVAGRRRILSNLLDPPIRRTARDALRIELGVGVLVAPVEIIVVQAALLAHPAAP